MEGTGTRWLVTLFLLTAAKCPSWVTSQTDMDSEDSRRVLGSSVVTSVSVIMDHGNGTKTYFADGQSKHVHKPTDTIIGSPGNLLSPDRYEFYTFDETGDLVKRLMTLDEIHGLIAGADPESVMADASPTYYHDALSSHSSEALMHLPATDLESLDAPAVHKVLESVQNVLKNEMAANSGKPIPAMPSSSLHRPDSASAWSALFPGLIETPDDVAQLSGYLLPSKTTESVEKPLIKKPQSSTKIPLTSIQPPLTTVRLPSSSIKTYYSTTTEKVRSTPKYTTVKPELTTKFTQIQSTTLKPTTNKKPFRPVQSFDKQKPTIQKPTLILHPTAKPSTMADGIDINKEMSASISDMLSQVTDSQSSNHKPLQTNTLIEKDNTADYVPEESSPELSYYSPMAMSLSTAAALKPVTEALTSAKRPPSTVAFKTTSTETPFSQKITSGITTTRFGPTKSNMTKPRPSINVTTASYTAKPSSSSKHNGTTSTSTTRNNYQYPPSNMSTKYMQKITQTTQAYPNKLIDSFVKVVNKTINNTTLSVKQPSETHWNFTEDIKNKFNKEPNKVFQTKVTSVRPNGINRTNVTLSNRVQELKTTAIPSVSSSTTTVRSQTEPYKYVSVKVEEWPMTVQHPTASPSTTPFASTEKSFFSSNSQPLSAITDPNAIRDLLSSLMVRSTTAPSVSASTVSPSTTVGTVQTLTAAVSTTTPTPMKTMAGIPASIISSTTEVLATTLSTTTTPSTMTTLTTTVAANTTLETTTTAAATTIGLAMVKTAVEEVATTASVKATAGTTTAGTTTAGTTSAGTTTAGTTTAGTTTAGTTTAGTTTASTTTVGTTTAGTTTGTTATSSSAWSWTTAGTAATASSTTAGSTAATTASRTTVDTSTTVSSTTPESETQYVPVTHFLPELQVKGRPETENNTSPPGVDPMLKDGISAVANMLQNTQKPAMLNAEYQEMGEQSDEKVMSVESKQQQSSTEQERRQVTVKSDVDETTVTTVTAATDKSVTQDLYEFTTTMDTTTTNKLPELNDTVAMESVSVTNDTEQISRISEPGLEMLTVFNVSSTGGPVQVAKLADLSAETQNFFDATTTPYETHSNAFTTDQQAATTEEQTTFAISSTLTPSTTITTTTSTTPAVVATSAVTSAATTTTTSASTPAAEVNNGTTWSSLPTGGAPSASLKSPGPSSNAYRPLANSASPSTVELHPAPHESMGLEASVAFLGDDVRRFADLCNELSFKMWTAVTGKGQIASRSLVLSPFELTAMLAMVFLGARGSTSGQMNDILRLDDMVTFNPHQVLRNITHSITNVNNPGVATASFVREIYSHKGNGKILDFYKERVQQYYDGHVEEVDFNAISDVLRRRTNLLVKRQTLGRVVEYLRGSGLSLTPPFAAFSANVFQTSCESASTEGRDGEMYFVVRPSTRQRRLVPVPAAVWRSGFLAGYEPGLDATAVCLSPDSAVSTILVLPGQQGQVAPGDGLTRLEQRLIETSYRRGGWSRILRSLLPRPGLELQVPRFSHRSVLNATAALQKMGLRDVFSDQKADLRGVNGLYDLYLSDMLQVNTFSTCGEDVMDARHHVETYPASPQRMGRVEMLAERRRRRKRRDVTAAADDLPLHSPYSHLPLNLRPRQARLPDVPRLRFDRPFLYLVRHNPTGMIVYLGRFNPRLLP